MRNMKYYLLEKVINWILGGNLFALIEELVRTMADLNLSGEEKRKKVFEKAKEIYGNASDFLINLGIEVAVTLLKAKMGSILEAKKVGEK